MGMARAAPEAIFPYMDSNLWFDHLRDGGNPSRNTAINRLRPRQNGKIAR